MFHNLKSCLFNYQTIVQSAFGENIKMAENIETELRGSIWSDTKGRFIQTLISKGIMETQIQYYEGQVQTKLLLAMETRGGFPEKARLTFYYALMVHPV